MLIGWSLLLGVFYGERSRGEVGCLFIFEQAYACPGDG